MRPEEREDWYPRLAPWKNWEIPVPGKEAVVGFFAILAVSLALHLFVLWMCSLFRVR
jgi:hypothetical protein